MESIFKKINDNSSVSMYANLIEEVAKQNEEYKMNLIHTYFNEMKNVDKNSLSDKNLGIFEALDFFFNNMEVSIEEKNKKYKKNFLYMLDILCNHEKKFGIHTNERMLLGDFATINRKNKQYKKQ